MAAHPRGEVALRALTPRVTLVSCVSHTLGQSQAPAGDTLPWEASPALTPPHTHRPHTHRGGVPAILTSVGPHHSLVGAPPGRNGTLTPHTLTGLWDPHPLHPDRAERS